MKFIKEDITKEEFLEAITMGVYRAIYDLHTPPYSFGSTTAFFDSIVEGTKQAIREITYPEGTIGQPDVAFYNAVKEGTENAIMQLKESACEEDD